ncbi:MAG: hypothetical protein KAH13_00045 [Tenericutes bacterium]|nr:hypothetical protein [Mycoplasmatota bacterium]
MSILQEKILKQTKDMLLSVSKIYIVIYTIFVSAVFFLLAYLFGIKIDVFIVLGIVAISFGWTVLKEYLLYRRTNKQIKKQHSYLLEIKPITTLYIPIFGKSGMRLELKNVTLYFVEDKIFMEAYKQLRLKKDILESVTIKLGKELLINDYVESINHKYVTYNANLLYEDYIFSLANVDEIIDLIERNKGEKNDENASHKSSR